jgi:hypothetical protein
MRQRLHRIALNVATLAALAFGAGCVGDRPGDGTSSGPAAARPSVDMNGRWTFAAMNGTRCAMTFRGAAGAAEGTIAPEGGCPENFFTSRKWGFEQQGLVLRDHNGATLAHLAQSASGQFSGQSNSGLQITLTR